MELTEVQREQAIELTEVQREQATELTRSIERASYGANQKYRESKLWS